MDLKMPKILIVDDDSAMNFLLEEMLTDMGYDVVGTAKNGEQAVEKARTLFPDVILMDILMPGDMDGISAAKKIKQESDIAIIFTTGHGDPKYVERAKCVEPFGYVMKPFYETEIRAVVEIALYKSEMELQLKKNRRVLEAEIEKRKRIETALHKSERLLNETQTLTKVGGWEYDVGEKRIAWTDQVYRIYGVEKEYFDPNDLEKAFSFYAPEDRRKIERAFATSLNRGQSYDLELRFLSAKGEDLWVRTIGKPVLENGKVTKIVGNIMDITEPKKLRETLRRVQRMETISTLTGGIAHDYNNLMSIVIGNLSMAVEEAGPVSLLADFLNEATNASYKVRDLTHELMSLSRGGSPVKESGSLKKLLRHASEVIATENGITLKESIRNDLWPVAFDPYKMGAVFRNVLTNAAEAMPDGGTITVQAQNLQLEGGKKGFYLPLKPGNYVHSSIQDQGIGIAEAHLEKVLDPYFSTKARGVKKGMGLGLTTAYAIVNQHGGHIQIDSSPGAGTTVNIYLPAEGDPEQMYSTITSTDDKTSPVKRVLFMDDEEMLRTLAQQMLEHMGYAVVTVRDGLEAIEKYKQERDSSEPFDAVILDLTIKGGMGGEQTMRELLKIDPDVKAIVSSGYFNDPVMSDFEKYGFMGALAKPYEKKALKEVLESLSE